MRAITQNNPLKNRVITPWYSWFSGGYPGRLFNRNSRISTVIPKWRWNNLLENPPINNWIPFVIPLSPKISSSRTNHWQSGWHQNEKTTNSRLYNGSKYSVMKLRTGLFLNVIYIGDKFLLLVINWESTML